MINIPQKFEVKATQDEPLAVELRIGKNVLMVSVAVMLLVLYRIKSKK
ncbi:hypothetical protein [Idiomarina sp.]|nr:hypothetical protein [Idiomarina sp.]